MTLQITRFSLVYGLKATLPIEYEVESLRVVIGPRLTENQFLRNKQTDLEELDEKRRMAVQHIEAIQRRRKIIFDKCHKNKVLRSRMMVMIQDAKKLKFLANLMRYGRGPTLCMRFSLIIHFNWEH